MAPRPNTSSSARLSPGACSVLSCLSSCHACRFDRCWLRVVIWITPGTVLCGWTDGSSQWYATVEAPAVLGAASRVTSSRAEQHADIVAISRAWPSELSCAHSSPDGVPRSECTTPTVCM